MLPAAAAAAAALPIAAALLALLLAPAAAATTAHRPPADTHQPNATLQIIQEISVKLSTVSTVPEFYNLLAQYNHDYCDRQVLEELKKYCHSKAAKVALQNMKTFCETIFKRGVRRRHIRKAKTRIQNEIDKEAPLVDELLQKFRRSKTGCRPRQTVVDFPIFPGAVLLPRCTLVKRCSGCCKNALQMCSPVEGRVRKVRRKVVEIQVDTSSSDSKPHPRVKVMELEQHDACECACQGNATMCSAKQAFQEHNCSCVCRNEAERKQCEAPRTWDPTTCECDCGNQNACSSGYYPDPITCKCRRSSSINNLTTKIRKNAAVNKGLWS